MKKIVSLVIVLAIVMTMGLSVFADVDTFFPFLFKTANGTPTIDGVRDEAYDGSDMIDIMQPGMLDLALEGHATAKVWTLWDDTNIYVYAEVNDTTPATTYTEEKGGKEPWMLDSVEVYLDFANDKGTNVYMHEQELTGQFRFCRIADYPVVSGSGMYTEEAKDKVEFKVVDNGEAGYIVEAAIPHRDLAQKIGFSFQINDDMDNDEKRDITVYTKMDGYMACQMNYVYDTLDLEGCTATNGFEDDTILYNTIEDLHELNNPTVEEPADEPADEPTDEPADEPASSEDELDDAPVDEGGFDPLMIVWIVAGAVVVAVVIIIIIKSKKK